MGILRYIVRNDAMKVDPPEVYNWRVFALACAACFGGTLFGMDIGIIGGVLKLPDFEEEFGLADKSKIAASNLSANLVSVMQAGAIVGSLAAFPFIRQDWSQA